MTDQTALRAYLIKWQPRLVPGAFDRSVLGGVWDGEQSQRDAMEWPEGMREQLRDCVVRVVGPQNVQSVS